MCSPTRVMFTLHRILMCSRLMNIHVSFYIWSLLALLTGCTEPPPPPPTPLLSSSQTSARSYCSFANTWHVCIFLYIHMRRIPSWHDLCECVCLPFVAISTVLLCVCVCVCVCAGLCVVLCTGASKHVLVMLQSKEHPHCELSIQVRGPVWQAQMTGNWKHSLRSLHATHRTERRRARRVQVAWILPRNVTFNLKVSTFNMRHTEIIFIEASFICWISSQRLFWQMFINVKAVIKLWCYCTLYRLHILKCSCYDPRFSFHFTVFLQPYLLCRLGLLDLYCPGNIVFIVCGVIFSAYLLQKMNFSWLISLLTLLTRWQPELPHVGGGIISHRLCDSLETWQMH